MGTLALYAVSFGNGLTNWDDPAYVVDNAFAQAGWRGFGLAFTRSFDFAYYPLTQAAYVALWECWGRRRPGTTWSRRSSSLPPQP